jgi:hypothetical protein
VVPEAALAALQVDKARSRASVEAVHFPDRRRAQTRFTRDPEAQLRASGKCRHQWT